MNLFTKNDLKELMAYRDTLCASIFIPTIRTGQDAQISRIELKNQLSAAYDKLMESGMRSADAEQMLKPAKELLDETLFWQHQSDGLAIFLSPDVFHYYRVPIKLNSDAVVKRHFYVKPLLPLFGSERTYYVLAASQNRVRLIQCRESGAEEVAVNEMPQSLADALKYDVSEKHLNYHSNSQKNGHSTSVYHGIGGGGTDYNKNNILRYFKQVDNALQKYFKNDTAPLILFAVDFLHPIYQTASSLENFRKEGMEGNPDELSPNEILNQSMDFMKPYFQRDEAQALENFDSNLAHGNASVGLDDIVPAAANGQIETLFLSEDAQQWGIFDEMTAKIMYAEESNSVSEDLYELAAVHTLLKDGKVFVEAADRMPQGEKVAAVFRY